LNRNVALTSLAWGLFFVLIGLSWTIAYYYNYAIDLVAPYVAFGTGLILIGLSMARTSLGMDFNWFSVFIGVVAVVFGGAALMGYGLPIIPTIIVLIGLFIIAEAVASLSKKK